MLLCSSHITAPSPRKYRVNTSTSTTLGATAEEEEGGGGGWGHTQSSSWRAEVEARLKPKLTDLFSNPRSDWSVTLESRLSGSNAPKAG